jgi:AcrR family transcriptional regulator
MPTPALRSRDRSPGTRRREQAIRVVLDLAAGDSPDRITTARISEAMGLSTGALFRHFPDKDALWEAALHWATSELDASFTRCEANDTSPRAVLRSIFDGHLAFVRAHPGVPRLIFAELQRPDDTAAKQVVRDFLKAYARRLAGWIRRGQNAGEIDAGIDPPAAAALFIGSIQGLVMQSLLAADPGRLRKAAPAVRTLLFEHTLAAS